MTPGTLIILLLILGGAALAIKRMFTKGLCDCKGECGECSGNSDSDGCSCCSHTQGNKECEDLQSCPVAEPQLKDIK